MTSSRFTDRASDTGIERHLPRRAFLGGLGQGLAGMALASLCTDDLAADFRRRPLHAPRARRVIWLFLRGGLSHLESFDPKPELNRLAGKSIAETQYAFVQDPERLKRVRVVVVNDANGQQRNTIYPLQVGFKKYGQSGIEVSDWFPHLGTCVDRLAVIRSMWTTDDNHGAQVQFHSGRHMLEPRVPTIGAWVSWGLGRLSEELPRFVSIGPRFFDVRDGHYLGPEHDAVPLTIDGNEPLPYASPEFATTSERQRIEFDLVDRLHRLAAQRNPQDAELTARIQSYQLAYKMQSAVPDLLDFDTESRETRNLYGLDAKPTQSFGRQLLAARRMAERGVRFIQIFHGQGAAGGWDAHSGLKNNHTRLAGQVDKPIAGLLTDLERRGLLDDTLVVLATEFGRTPGSQGGDGRDHHPFGFSVCLAGGGVRGGVVHGATDEIGFHATEHPHYVTDVHATILHQLGLDPRHLEIPGHKRLERDFGEVIHEILA